MERKDQFSGVFWLLISLVVIQQSLTMRLGTFRNPGPGLVPLVWGTALAILSGTILIKACLGAKGDAITVHINWTSFRRLGTVIAALTAYAFIFPHLGFFSATFLLLTFLFRDPQSQKWWIPLFEATITILGAYFLFHLLLQMQFPRGPWMIR